METGFVRIPFNKLVKADWNYKEEDKKLSKKLLSQIKKNGQVENVLVRELGKKFEVINGNHRYDIFEILKVDYVMCYNFGKISKAQAQRIAIETNETKFDKDENKLANLLKDLTIDYTIEDLSSTMPYSEDDIIELVDFDDEKNAGNSKKESGTTAKTVTFIIDEDSGKKLSKLKEKHPELSHNEIFVYMLNNVK